ncbi:MAG: helix-turn-helix domain-containing protein [Pseudonocardiaceae bacterium]
MREEPPELTAHKRALGRQLAALREAAEIGQQQVARKTSYSRPSVAHVEAGRQLLTREFWKTADELLKADGVLLAEYEQVRAAKQAHDARCREEELAEAYAQARALRAATSPYPIQDHAGLAAVVEDAGTTGPGPGQPPVPLGEVTNAKRRELFAAAVVAPELLNQVLSEAAAEAMEFTRLTGVSSVGRGTLEHLELVLSDLNRGYSHEPPAGLFAVARAYRFRVDELIRGQHTLTELRELYVYAGGLSELLAWLANDLGHPRTARAYAVDSYAYAEQAGHGEMCGWAADAMTGIATYSAPPGTAVQVAMKGLAQVARGHPLAIRLRAKAARACARLGDRDRCETLFAEARELHDQLPADPPSRFTLDIVALARYAVTAYPAEAYLWLGDFETARAHAEAALALHQSAPSGSSTPGKGDIARLDLATALAHLGAPDEATALGRQALTSTCAYNSVRAHARDLNAALVSRYPTMSCVRDFHEQYRHMTKSPAEV